MQWRINLLADILTDRYSRWLSESPKKLCDRWALCDRKANHSHNSGPSADRSQVGQARGQRLKVQYVGRQHDQTCEEVIYADPKYCPGAAETSWDKSYKGGCLTSISFVCVSFSEKCGPPEKLNSILELEQLINLVLTTKWIANYFSEEKSQNSLTSASYMWIFLLVSLLPYDSKLNIFTLWIKQDIWERHLWETLINIFTFLASHRPNN